MRLRAVVLIASQLVSASLGWAQAPGTPPALEAGEPAPEASPNASLEEELRWLSAEKVLVTSVSKHS